MGKAKVLKAQEGKDPTRLAYKSLPLSREESFEKNNKRM